MRKGTRLDDFFETKMAESHIPGGAIVVVKDSKVFLAKGYGFADLVPQIPVDPARTAFRAGSVSKLFTWTAVMQAAAGALSVAFLALAVVAWLRAYWSLVNWLYYSSIALASVLFVLFAGYWNMLGWKF